MQYVLKTVALAMVTLGMSAAVLPDGYRQVEYIQSTGRQYIDTGCLVSGSGMKIEADFAFDDVDALQQRVFGSQTWDESPTTTKLTCSLYLNGSHCFAWALKNGVGNWVSTQVSATTGRFRFTLDGIGNRARLFDVAANAAVYDNEIGSVHTGTTEKPLAIFASREGDDNVNLGKLRLYAFSISDRNGLVRDYTPCVRERDGQPGLYDSVTGRFDTSNRGRALLHAGPDANDGLLAAGPAADVMWDGTDAPVTTTISVTDADEGTPLVEGTDYRLVYSDNTGVGRAKVRVEGLGTYGGRSVTRSFAIQAAPSRLPAAYRELDFVQCDGSTYLDTGINATSNTAVSLDLSLPAVSSSCYMLGQRFASTDNDLIFSLYLNVMDLLAVNCYDAGKVSDGHAAGAAWNGKGSATATLERPNAGDRLQLTLDSPGNAVFANGRKILELGSARAKTTASPLFIFNHSVNGLACGDIHSVRITESGQLVAALVPAERRADGAVGLYDLQRGVFLTDASEKQAGFIAGPSAVSRTFDVVPVADVLWDGIAEVRPAATVTDRVTGASLVDGTDFASSYDVDAILGTGRLVVTGRGAYAGRVVTNDFAVSRAGTPFTFAVWNVQAFTNGPTATGLIEWSVGRYADLVAVDYPSFYRQLDADWLSIASYLDNFSRRDPTVSQMYARWGLFADAPSATTPADVFSVGNASFNRNSRFEILSSEEIAFPTRDAAPSFLEQRVRIDGAVEAVFATVTLDETPVTRDAQIAFLAARYANEPRVVLSGAFATAKFIGEVQKRCTDWDALDAFVSSGFVLANAAAPTGSMRTRNDVPDAATTHVLAKGFSVRAAEIRAPYLTDTATYSLSGEGVLLCTIAPLGAGQVARPSDPAPQLYVGSPLTPMVAASDAYTVTYPENCVTAGTYMVTISLKNPGATSWDDGTTDDLVRRFTIESTDNEWTTSPHIASEWRRADGAPVLTLGAAKFGTVTCNYTPADLGALGKGTYDVVFTVPGTSDYAELTKTVHVTVIDPFVARVSADGTTADFDVGSCTVARELYIAYDAQDQGLSTSRWARVVHLATIPRRIVTLTNVALPVDDPETADYPVYRFFMTTPDLTSSSYTMSGLIAQWDAIDNAGRGRHEAAPETWRELVNDTPITWKAGPKDANPRAPSYTANGVAFEGYYFDTTIAGVKEALNAKAFTVQVMMRPTPNTWEWYRGLFQFGPGSGNRQLILDTRKQTENAPYINRGNYSISGLQFRETGWNQRSIVWVENDFAGKDVVVTVTVDANGAHLWFDGQEKPVFTSPGGAKDAESDLFTFGYYIGNLCYRMTARTIRIYDRTLSADEVVRNAGIDFERYGSGLTEASASFTRPARPLTAQLRGTATADVRFTAFDRARSLVYAWGSRDGGALTNGWEGAAVVAQVPAGTTHLTDVPLPAAAKGAVRCRFFLAPTTFLASDYSQEGLLLQLDAINNAAPNLHTSNASHQWVELVSGKGLSPYGVNPDNSKIDKSKAGAPVYEATGVKLTNAWYQTTVPGLKEAINAKSCTVQMFMNPTSYKMYEAAFQIGQGGSNREIILDVRHENGQSGDYSFGGLQYMEDGWNGRSVISAPNYFFGSNVLATVTTDSKGAHLWFDAPSAANFSNVGGGKAATSDLMTIAAYIGNFAYPMTLRAVRVYNRTLTAEEIAASRALDAYRFLGEGEPPWVESETLVCSQGTVFLFR